LESDPATRSTRLHLDARPLTSIAAATRRSNASVASAKAGKARQARSRLELPAKRELPAERVAGEVRRIGIPIPGGCCRRPSGVRRRRRSAHGKLFLYPFGRISGPALSMPQRLTPDRCNLTLEYSARRNL
jgi:hypothetical protein